MTLTTEQNSQGTHCGDAHPIAVAALIVLCTNPDNWICSCSPERRALEVAGECGVIGWLLLLLS